MTTKTYRARIRLSAEGVTMGLGEYTKWDWIRYCLIGIIAGIIVAALLWDFSAFQLLEGMTIGLVSVGVLYVATRLSVPFRNYLFPEGRSSSRFGGFFTRSEAIDPEDADWG